MGSPVPRPPGPVGLGLMEGTDLLKGCWFFSPGPLLPWNSAALRLPWLQEGRFCVKSTHLEKAYIYIYGCTGSSSVLRLSLAAESGAPLQLWRTGFSLQWLLRGGRLRSCGTQV